MKRLIFVFSLLSFAGGKIYAQKAYTYVRQNGTKLEKLGTAAFDVGEKSQPRVHFVDGKAVMTIGETRVAALPMKNGGELVVSYTADVAEADLNKVTKKPTEQKPFATIYSPFQLVVPSGSEVYAPVFNPDNMLLHFADDQRVAEGGIVPVETPLVIHGTSPVEFTFSATDPTCGLTRDLRGSSLKIDTPTDATVFTFGIGKTGPHTGEFGLFRYTGTSLNPGVYFLQVAKEKVQDVNFVALSFEPYVTGVKDLKTCESQPVTKRVEHGRVVIVKAGKKYNTNGQNIK